MCSKLSSSQLGMLNWETVCSLASSLIIGFYWKAIFDPQDDLYKLVAGFNQFAVQEIASQVSQISLLLERHHAETSSAIEGISREVGLLRQEAQENSYHVRRASDLLEKMATGLNHPNPANSRDTHRSTNILPRNRPVE